MTPVVNSVRIWADMVKLAHSIFALPFSMMAAFLAGRNLSGGLPEWGHLGLIVMCMVAARSAAMTFNRIVDWQLDARNPRTASRPLPAGKLSMPAAWLMFTLSALMFGAGCLGFYFYYQNTWPMLLSGPVLVYLCGYSFTKRFTRWSHFYLGCGIAFSPVASWIVVHPESLGWPAALLMLLVACWIGGFDIIYACQDIDVDRRDGLLSLPSTVGPARALLIAKLAHAIAATALIALGLFAQMGIAYFVGTAVAIALLVVQNLIVHPNDFRRVNFAFFTLNGVVSVVLASTAVVDILMHR